MVVPRVECLVGCGNVRLRYPTVPSTLRPMSVRIESDMLVGMVPLPFGEGLGYQVYVAQSSHSMCGMLPLLYSGVRTATAPYG